MRKWIIAAIVLLVLCAAAFVALLNANALINRNKDYLLDQAQRSLGRKVSVGDLEVTIFSGIGVRLHDFAMSDDPAFSSGDFIRAKDLQVNLKLFPLLMRRFQVKRMILHGPVITVIRNAKKEYNFSTIGEKPREPKEKAKPGKKERAVPKGKGGAPALFVSLVDISDGQLHYRDLKDGSNLDLKKIDLKVKDFDFGRPFTVEMGVAVFAAKQNFRLKSRVGPLSADTDFRDTPVSGELQVDALDVRKVKDALPRLKKVMPKALGFNGVYTIKDLKFTGTLNHLSLKGAIEGTDGSLRFGDVFQKAPGIPLKVSADASYAADKVTLRQADITLHTLTLSGKGDVRLGGAPAINLSINSRPFSLGGWEKILPPMAAYQLGGKMELHATVRGKIGDGAAPAIQGTLTWADGSARPPNFPKPIENINANVRFTGERADITQTTLSLGRSKILLGGAVERFSPLAISYKLSTAEIWPADFQASLPEERKGDVLRNLNNDGKITVTNGQVTYHGKLSSGAGTLHKIGYKNLEAGLSLANKVADIRDLRVSVLNGMLHADGQYAFNDPVPRFTLATKMQGIDIHQLYENLNPKAERDIRGRLNADIKVAGSGKEWKEMEPSLHGAGEAEVLQGALLNFNVAQGALSGITGIPGLTNVISPELRKKYPEIFEAKDTEFKEMKTVFNVADSRVNVKDLRIAAADYGVQGKGWVNFKRRVDFQSMLTLSQRLSADVADSAREIKILFNNQNQLELPFSLTGKLPKVKPRPDSRYLGRMVERGMTRRGLEELQRQFFGSRKPSAPEESAPSEPQKKKKSTTEDLIRKGLEGLFGR
jgi:AsmA protein